MANALLEAAACGRPVIATTVPGCKETFVEGETGLGCESHSVESLLKAMKKMIAFTNEQRLEMGLKGRVLMEKTFNRNIIVSKYLKELEIPVKAKLDGDYAQKVSFGFDVKCFLGSVGVFAHDDTVVEGGTGEMKKEQAEKSE